MKNKFEFIGHPAVIVTALFAWVLVWRLLLVGPVPAWRLGLGWVCFVGYIVILIIPERSWPPHESPQLIRPVLPTYSRYNLYLD